MSLSERLKYAEMKARHKNIFTPWYKKWWGLIIIALSAILIASLIGAIYYVVTQAKQINQEKTQTTFNSQQAAYLETIKGPGTNYYGTNNNPKVVIVEFGDFACPYCEKSYLAIRQATQEHKNQVQFIWRDYPIHANSVELAEAARCAGEQGKFWEMHDALFAHQAQLTETGDALGSKLLGLAESLGLSSNQFSACYTSKKYIAQIKNDYQDGERLQVQGTPTWFINNRSVTGALPLEKFQELFSFFK